MEKQKTGSPQPNLLDATVDEVPQEADISVQLASQWKLMWWRFRKHKLALVSSIVIILVYLVAALVEFLAPFPPDRMISQLAYAPPQRLRLWEKTDEGLKFGMYVYGYAFKINALSLERTFTVDTAQKIPVRFFVKGAPYRLWGLVPWNRHLIGPVDPQAPMYLLGADRLGRDLFSRIIYGTRVSMTIGLVGVTLSLVLGVILGGVSGYYGGLVDLLIQRVMEILRSMPTIPLWMGLAAAIPAYWSPLLVYFMITIILSVIGWTWLAQAVRGKFYSLKTEDFVIAAKLDGCSELQVILSHMVPSFTSHIIATLTLAIPQMIIAETALSFLGIGLRPPVVSWGVLLREAQNVRVLATSPWLFLPGAAVIVAVLALNFLGDGIRDAADPYK
ncbi:MAG: ABC transporter permease [Desulfobacterales bacterium]|jgi:peptide/nickel transport system permease protein